MKNKIICFLFIFLFSVIMLFVSIVPECFAVTATDNVYLTTGTDAQNTFSVDILPAFVDNNINFNDWSLAYYFSYKNGYNYEFYISSGPIQVGQNGIMKTTGNNTLYFTMSLDADNEPSWVYNTFYGPNANIGNYNYNAFYFLNQSFSLALNANNFSVDPDYFQVDLTIIPDEPEEEDPFIDFSALGDFLLHFIIPTERQFETLQEQFMDDVVENFAIPAISRGGIEYDNRLVYTWIGDNKPVITIYGYDFDFQMLDDFMHTPFDFGHAKEDFGSSGDWVVTIQDGGLSPYNIINIMFGIYLSVFNVVMYVKFFEKE